MNEIKKLAKKIQQEVDKNGWSIQSHTNILALLYQIKTLK